MLPQLEQADERFLAPDACYAVLRTDRHHILKESRQYRSLLLRVPAGLLVSWMVRALLLVHVVAPGFFWTGAMG
jgi:hypothetical protein